MTDIEQLWTYNLRRGNSDHPRNGACLMDAANWIVYGEIGDDPASTCPVIRAYAIVANDMLPDDQRQRLKPFILRVVGNRDPENEHARAEYLVRRTVGVVVPSALDAALAAGIIASVRPARGAEWAVGVAAASARAAYRAAKAAESARNTRLRQKIYDAVIETLNGVLKIGKQADPFEEAAVRRAVSDFEDARNGFTSWLDDVGAMRSRSDR